MKELMDESSNEVPNVVRSGKQGYFKKKTEKNSMPDTGGDYFRVLLFHIGRDGPNL